MARRRESISTEASSDRRDSEQKAGREQDIARHKTQDEIGKMTQDLRVQFTEALKVALRAKEVYAVSTLRLILASLKDRDIALRSQGKGENSLAEHEILAVLQTMIRQRQESIAAYEKAGRPAHANQEQREIEVIRRFLPKPMSETQMEQAIKEIIETKNLSGLKGMSCVMSELRKRHPGAVDFAFAGKSAKEKLLQR